jgi:hypothetical protein
MRRNTSRELKDKVEAASSSQADTDGTSACGSGSAMPATVYVHNHASLVATLSEPLDDDYHFICRGNFASNATCFAYMHDKTIDPRSISMHHACLCVPDSVNVFV